MQLEVAVVPVCDVDKTKQFHAVPGWRLDADFATDDHFRVVQARDPVRSVSIIFGTDIEAARAALGSSI